MSSYAMDECSIAVHVVVLRQGVVASRFALKCAHPNVDRSRSILLFQQKDPQSIAPSVVFGPTSNAVHGSISRSRRPATASHLTWCGRQYYQFFVSRSMRLLDHSGEVGRRDHDTAATSAYKTWALQGGAQTSVADILEALQNTSH